MNESVFFINSSNVSSITAGAKGLYGFLGGSRPMIHIIGNFISCIDNFASFVWRSFISAGVTSLDMALHSGLGLGKSQQMFQFQAL